MLMYFKFVAVCTAGCLLVFPSRRYFDSATLEIQFVYVIPVTERQGRHSTSSCSRTGRSRRLRAMLAERDAKTGGAGIQIAAVGTFW